MTWMSLSRTLNPFFMTSFYRIGERRSMRRGPADGSLPRVMQRVILVLDLGSSRLRCALVPLDGDGAHR